MTLHGLVESLLKDTLDVSIPLFFPELVLCGTIVLMLLTRVVRLDKLVPPFFLALLGSVVALWSALPQEGIAAWAEMEAVRNVHRHAGLRFALIFRTRVFVVVCRFVCRTLTHDWLGR